MPIGSQNLQSEPSKPDIVVPKFLLKLGSTYFRKFQELDLQNLKKRLEDSKKKARNNSKSKAKVKMESKFKVKPTKHKSCATEYPVDLPPNQNPPDNNVIQEFDKNKKQEKGPELSNFPRKRLHIIAKTSRDNKGKSDVAKSLECPTKLDNDQNLNLHPNPNNFNEKAKDAKSRMSLNSFSEISSQRSVSFNKTKRELEGDIATVRSESGKICCICYDKESDAVIMPCGHGGICYTCILDSWKNNPTCHMCRGGIEFVLQIDLNCLKANIMKVISYTYQKPKPLSGPKESLNTDEFY